MFGQRFSFLRFQGLNKVWIEVFCQFLQVSCLWIVLFTSFSKLLLRYRIFFVRGYSCQDEALFEISFRPTMYFPKVVVLDDSFLSVLAGNRLRFSPMLLQPVETGRCTPPRELVGKPYRFAKVQIYLSHSIRYSLTAPLWKVPLLQLILLTYRYKCRLKLIDLNFKTLKSERAFFPSERMNVIRS